MDALSTYMDSLGKSLVLNAEEEATLVEKAKTSNSAKNKLIESNLKLVVYFCKPYLNKGVDMDDLIQEGNIGLLIALDKFDASKGFRFCTYAGWWIKQRVRRAIANNSSMKETAFTEELIEELDYKQATEVVEDGIAKEQIDTILERLVDKNILNERDVRVFYAHILQEKNLSEIGKELELSRERTRQIYNKVLYKLENSKELQADFLS